MITFIRNTPDGRRLWWPRWIHYGTAHGLSWYFRRKVAAIRYERRLLG